MNKEGERLPNQGCGEVSALSADDERWITDANARYNRQIVVVLNIKEEKRSLPRCVRLRMKAGRSTR